MCRRRQHARPSRGTGPGPASPSRFIHSEPGAAAPLRFRTGRVGDPTPRGRVWPQPPPKVRAPPRFPRARGLCSGVVRETAEARTPDQNPATPPSTRAQARLNPFVGGRLEAPGPRRRAVSPRPEVSPAPPPQRPTSLAAAVRPSPCSLGPPNAGRGPEEASGHAARSAKKERPEQGAEAGVGGYLDDPTGQPGHLVRSRVRPLVSTPAPLASRTSGSPRLHFRGTLPRPPPPPPPPAWPLGKCSPCSAAGRLPSDLAPRHTPRPSPGLEVAEVTRSGGAGTWGRWRGAASISGAGE